jgi:hypothetical protein
MSKYKLGDIVFIPVMIEDADMPTFPNAYQISAVNGDDEYKAYSRIQWLDEQAIPLKDIEHMVAIKVIKDSKKRGSGMSWERLTAYYPENGHPYDDKKPLIDRLARYEDVLQILLLKPRIDAKQYSEADILEMFGVEDK